LIEESSEALNFASFPVDFSLLRTFAFAFGFFAFDFAFPGIFAVI